MKASETKRACSEKLKRLALKIKRRCSVSRRARGENCAAASSARKWPKKPKRRRAELVQSNLVAADQGRLVEEFIQEIGQAR